MYLISSSLLLFLGILFTPTPGFPQRENVICGNLTAANEFERSSAVFQGKVMEKRFMSGSFDMSRGLVLFEVIRKFKGDLTERAEVFALPAFYGRYKFHRGEEFLIYAYAEEPYPYVIGNCTRSRPVAEAKADLAILENLAPQSARAAAAKPARTKRSKSSSTPK